MTVRRYAVAAAACELMPVPVLDTLAQNHLRRIAVAKTASEFGIEICEARLAELCDEPIETGARLLRAILLWPFKKLLRTVFFGWTMWRMWCVAADLVERAGGVVALADGPGDASGQGTL